MNSPVQGRGWSRRAGTGAAVLIAVAIAAGAVGAALAVPQATLDGAPVAAKVITEGIARSTQSTTFVTLHTTNVTVPAGERHVVIVRLTGSANCTDPNAIANVTIPPRCAIRMRVGGGNATPGFLEFTGRSILHAAAARGALSAGTYAVHVQWSVYTGGGRFNMPSGNLVEIEQIRVD